MRVRFASSATAARGCANDVTCKWVSAEGCAHTACLAGEYVSRTERTLRDDARISADLLRLVLCANATWHILLRQLLPLVRLRPLLERRQLHQSIARFAFYLPRTHGHRCCTVHGRQYQIINFQCTRFNCRAQQTPNYHSRQRRPSSPHAAKHNCSHKPA